MRRALLLLILFAMVLLSQTSYPNPGQSQFVQGTIPSSTATVVASTIRVMDITLCNKTGSSVTITIQDRSTDCGGAACNFLNAVSIAANTTYAIQLGAQVAPSGLQWSASAGSSVDAKIRYMAGLY